MHIRHILAVTALPLSVTSVFAASPLGAGAHVGSTGIGLDLIYEAAPSLNLRLTGAMFNKSYDKTSDNVKYDGNLKLRTIGFLADYFPSTSNFRITAGLILNKNKFDLSGQPENGSYTINGTTYTASQVGSLDGKVDFRSTAPYLGIGWGSRLTPKSNISLVADLGIMFQGSPKVNVTASGAAADPSLANDVNAAKDKLRDDLKDYRYYPVLSVGAIYSF